MSRDHNDAEFNDAVQASAEYHAWKRTQTPEQLRWDELSMRADDVIRSIVEMTRAPGGWKGEAGEDHRDYVIRRAELLADTLRKMEGPRPLSGAQVIARGCRQMAEQEREAREFNAEFAKLKARALDGAI
jgi:hypothetical protein